MKTPPVSDSDSGLCEAQSRVRICQGAKYKTNRVTFACLFICAVDNWRLLCIAKTKFGTHAATGLSTKLEYRGTPTNRLRSKSKALHLSRGCGCWEKSLRRVVVCSIFWIGTDYRGALRGTASAYRRQFQADETKSRRISESALRRCLYRSIWANRCGLFQNRGINEKII